RSVLSLHSLSSAFSFLSFFCSSSGAHRDLHSFPTRRSSDLHLLRAGYPALRRLGGAGGASADGKRRAVPARRAEPGRLRAQRARSEEHTSELQSRENLVCRLLLEKKKNIR